MTDDTTRAVLARYAIEVPYENGSTTWVKKTVDVRAMAARIAELERNAKRYQYLRARVDGYDHPAQSITILFPWKTLTVGVPESLDAAIDTAMQEATHD